MKQPTKLEQKVLEIGMPISLASFAAGAAVMAYGIAMNKHPIEYTGAAVFGAGLLSSLSIPLWYVDRQEERKELARLGIEEYKQK